MPAFGVRRPQKGHESSALDLLSHCCKQVGKHEAIMANMAYQQTRMKISGTTVSTTLVTRLYLIGVGVALALSGVTLAFPQVPASVMLGILGAIFLTLASWTHRHNQAQREPRPHA